MTNNLKSEIKRVVEDSDLLTRLNELADLLHENGDTRLSINTERGQWVWHNKDLTSLIEQEKERADIDSMKKIDGFMGFNVGGSGVWYALFDTESSFWKFLNRNSMSRSVEPPMTPVGRYSCRDTTEIRVLVNWLLEEYEQYLAERKG